MLFRRLLGTLTVIALAVTCGTPGAAATVTTMVTKPIAKPLVFVGFLFHIISIETVATPFGEPAFKKMGDCNTPYIKVVASLQNTSKANQVSPPEAVFDFELSDGSHLSGPPADGSFIYPSLGAIPGYIYPLEHLKVLYMICNWNGQAPTKLFLTNNGAGGDGGYSNIRFYIPKGFAKAIGPAPTPSPA